MYRRYENGKVSIFLYASSEKYEIRNNQKEARIKKETIHLKIVKVLGIAPSVNCSRMDFGLKV